jgi:tRNA pseudouridine55 synthase
VCAFLLDARKSYRFVAKLGERTDTGDADGIVVERTAIPVCTAAQIESVLHASVGEQSQVPPMYSALKHEGQRLYDMARRGENVERAPRRIVIETLTLVRLGVNEIEVNVRCSKGTYVRTLAEDIAAKLGTLAHLTELRRIQVDPFVETMVTVAELSSLAASGLSSIDRLLIPADQALERLPTVNFDLDGQQALLRGQSAAGLGSKGLPLGELVRMYGPNRVFLGLGEAGAAEAIQPRRLFVKSSTGQ